MNVKVRFAPSPTGYLHVGNARTALISWLFARHNSGHFMLRIDDTDQSRSKAEYEQEIEHSLTWLGMDWDSKANQLERMDIYAQRIEFLKEQGRLYPCYETPDELALKRKSLLARGKPPTYDRGALSLSDEQIKAYEVEGRRPHWRFKLNHTDIRWEDMVRGPVHFNGADQSDPVVLREDGSPLYHLCSVIDDIDFEITHIIRGEDHVSNTACHVQMIEALGGKVPQFAHLPLLSDAEGGKLSKRLGSLSIKDIREEDGLEAMSVVSLMARMGTSEPIEAFKTNRTLVEGFDFSKFSRNTPKFDADELLRLNAKILHETELEEIQSRLSDLGFDSVDENFWKSVRANLVRVSDIQEWWTVANGPVEPIVDADNAEFITQAATMLPAEPWDKNTWMAWVNEVKAATGRKGKQLFMPLRQALTGMDHGPELGVLLPLIGRERAERRLVEQKKVV